MPRRCLQLICFDLVVLLVSLGSTVLLRLASIGCGLDLLNLHPHKGGLPELAWTGAHWLGFRNLALLIGMLPGYGQVYFAAPPSNNNRDSSAIRVAITIDDAVGVNTTGVQILLSSLAELSVPATFFVIADDRTLQHGHQMILEDMVKLGHEIGNHGIQLGSMMSMDSLEVRSAIETWEQRVRGVLLLWPVGRHSRKLFRPPKGLMSQTMEATLREMSYDIVLGDIYSDDWLIHDAQFHTNVLTKAACDGSIIILHIPDRPSRLQTIDILRTAIPALRARGVSFVTMSELLGPTGENVIRGGRAPLCAECAPCMRGIMLALLGLVILLLSGLMCGFRLVVRALRWHGLLSSANVLRVIRQPRTLQPGVLKCVLTCMPKLGSVGTNSDPFDTWSEGSLVEMLLPSPV